MSDYRAMAAQAQARIDRTDVDTPVDRRRDVRRPPGPPAVITLPRLLKRGDATAQFFLDVERDYQPMAHTRLLGQHLYILTDPAAVVDVFLTHGRHTMKGRGLQAAKALLGNGLLTSEGDTHRQQRRLVQPAFHRDRIAGYSADMVHRSTEWADRLRPGDEFDIVTEMSSLTLAIVGDTLFGLDLAGEAREVGEALSGVLEGAGGRLILGPAAMKIPTPGRRAALESTARLDAVVARLIDEHRRESDSGDILSMLVASRDEGAGMSDEQVRDEVMTLMLAGHETTAMALSWAWLVVAATPGVEDWWHDELDTVLGGREPAHDDLELLHRTRAIVAETLRLFPPAWIMGRRLLADIETGGYTLPAGTIALASILALHRSHRWWTDPERFVPQRWLRDDGTFDETAPGQPRGSWCGFGFGNRRWIGEQFAWSEAALVMATVGGRWSLRRTGHAAVHLRPNITLRPAGDVGMAAYQRQ